MANDNALDAHSNLVSATVASGVVNVTTQAQDPAGNNHFSLVFARALGINTADIKAYAQATFGGFSAANVVPLTFSKCESDPGFTKDLQFFPTHGSALADSSGYDCMQKPASGWELPGGFGWLNDPSSNCSAFVDVSSPWVQSSPGNDFDNSCTATFAGWQSKLAAGQTVEILIPIFDISCPDKGGSGTDPCSSSPYGSNGKAFHIEAFAQISLRGWHLIGGGSTYYTADASALSTSLGLKNKDTGLFGKFIKKVSIAEAAVMNGPTTYGATGAGLSK
nr:hypothetical protein [Pseudarthrobacter psychrotolerans]